MITIPAQFNDKDVNGLRTHGMSDDEIEILLNEHTGNSKRFYLEINDNGNYAICDSRTPWIAFFSHYTRHHELLDHLNNLNQSVNLRTFTWIHRDEKERHFLGSLPCK